MRKILYTISLVLGIVGIAAMFIFPFYKFDNNKLKTKNYELALIYAEEYGFSEEYMDMSIWYPIYNNMSKDEKKAFKEKVKEYKTFAKGMIENDPNAVNQVYEYYDYLVIDQIYYEQKNVHNKNLNKDTSDETKQAIVDGLIDDMGEEAYGTAKTAKSLEIYNKYQEAIKKAQDDLPELGVASVTFELFQLSLSSDNELRQMTIDSVSKKGYRLVNIFTALKNTASINKAIYNQEEYKSLSFVDRIKATTSDPNFYNPAPLFAISLMLYIILAGLVVSIFRGIKGRVGRHRPALFISSIIMFSLCLLLLFMDGFISDSYYLQFHYCEYQRLLDLFRYGSFTVGILIPTGIFAVDIVIGALGVFCKFGKKRNVED